MRSIHTLLSIIMILLILTPFNLLKSQPIQKYKGPVDVKDALKESWLNRGEINGKASGRKEGIEEGKRIGFEEGRKKGFSEGFSAGIAHVGDSILTVLHEVYYNPGVENCGKLYDMVTREFQSKLNMRQQLMDLYYAKGEADGYQTGLREGMDIAFDSIYRLNLWHSQNIEFSKKIKHPSFVIDYEKIARLLGNIGYGKDYVEMAYFSDALKEVNLAVLEYLTDVIELQPEEHSEVFQRYGEIHPILVEKAYLQYIKLCSSLNRNHDKSFYDYRFSVSTEAFLDILLFHLVTIADITFTFAKSNSQFAAWRGIEMGHINEIMFSTVFMPLVDYFRKNAIRLDYNANFPKLTQVTTTLLTPLIADTRTHKKTITETVQLSSYHSATITMEIETIIEVGYSLDDFDIIANHLKQIIWIHISNKPRLLRVIKQDYKVLCIKNSIIPRKLSERNTLSKSDLDGIFEKHKDPVENLSICTRKLRSEAVNIISPILVKTIEPAIAIPYSCYQVNMNFGSNTSSLINVGCN